MIHAIEKRWTDTHLGGMINRAWRPPEWAPTSPEHLPGRSNCRDMGFVPRILVKQVHSIQFFKLLLTISNIILQEETFIFPATCCGRNGKKLEKHLQKRQMMRKQSMRCFLFLSRTSTGGNCIPASGVHLSFCGPSGVPSLWNYQDLPCLESRFFNMVIQFFLKDSTWCSVRSYYSAKN